MPVPSKILEGYQARSQPMWRGGSFLQDVDLFFSGAGRIFALGGKQFLAINLYQATPSPAVAWQAWVK